MKSISLLSPSLVLSLILFSLFPPFFLSLSLHLPFIILTVAPIFHRIGGAVKSVKGDIEGERERE